ncbi:TPA: carbohydrate kinase family protein [Candidatus Gracilibacteria bacterium]|nr:carbohydrate kinase family protein [Candidatus Gracilibacteria bacterium]
MINNNKKIVILGSLTQDLFVYANGNSVITQSDENGEKEFYAIPHGGKLTAKYLERYAGGGGANVGVSLQRLGFESHVFGARGDDEVGSWIEELLQKEKVKIENIQVLQNTESGFSVILNSYQGERTVIFTSQANKKFREIHASDIEKIDPVAIYLCHISSGLENNITSELLHYLEKHNKTILSWNPGRERLELGVESEENKNLLAHCNLLFLNKEEAELFTGLDSGNIECNNGEKIRNKNYENKLKTDHSSYITDLPNYASDVSGLAEKLLQTGVSTVVITDGRKGVQVFTENKSFFVASLGGERVDTLGAGDSFSSAFTASVLRGNSLEDATNYARINAQSVVSNRGAQPGLLTESQLYENKLYKNK